MKLKLVAVYSPSVVLVTWALLLVAGVEGIGLKVGGLLVLGVALAYHVREELRGRARRT